jgi:glycosyltransferase involved in cell wall biosynthesis
MRRYCPPVTAASLASTTPHSAGHWPILAALAILAAGGLVLAVYWGAALWRAIRTLRTVPRVEQGLAFARRSPSTKRVALIVPAHNEESAITRLVPSLLAQDYPHLAIILCLDRCTDATEARARAFVANDPRVTILPITTAREGWAGKTSAVWTGVQHALTTNPDLLLFADADTIFDPDCITAAVGLLESRDLDLVSFLSTMTYDRWFEWLAQPAAGVELMRHYPLERINRRTGRRRAFANGQFMLFTRDAYTTVGGHAAVKDELLEDLALARAVQEGWHGFKRLPSGESTAALGVFFAGRFLRCRMYDTWPQFRQGWKRIFIEGAKRVPRRLRQGELCALWFHALGPALAGAASLLVLTLLNGPHHTWATITLGFAAAPLILMAIALSLSFARSQAPWRAIPAFPIGAWLVARILREARADLNAGTPVKWAGKEYLRHPR